MKSPASHATSLAGFPPRLRELVDAELAAGNAIVEISSTFPAPPAGACARLARPISSRPRASTPELSFYDRNSSLYSGEWTDPNRFYFVIEPPHPPEPVADMEAIRASLERAAAVPAVPPRRRARKRRPASPPPVPAAGSGAPASTVRRFMDSMNIDYEKWREGIGYDIALLNEASADDLQTIESILLDRGMQDWRDVEALAALNTTQGNELLRQAMVDGNARIRGAVLRHAPGLISTEEKTALLLAALKSAEFYAGLTEALDAMEAFHPPEIIDELFRCTLARKGGIACHFAAMLMFLHGRAAVPFDWDQRPFFLRFNTDDRAERVAVFRELCEKVGVDAGRFLMPDDL